MLGLTAEQLTKLKTGEAFIWSSKATDQIFSREAVKVTLRLEQRFMEERRGQQSKESS